MKKLGINVLGFESSVPFDFYDVLRQLQVTLTPLNGLVEQLRLVKDSEELQSIKEAIKRAEEAFMATKPRIRPASPRVPLHFDSKRNLRKGDAGAYRLI